jgi:hypothetical protein
MRTDNDVFRENLRVECRNYIHNLGSFKYSTINICTITLGLLHDIAILEAQLACAVKALEFYKNKDSYYVNGAAHMQNHISDSDLETFQEHRAYFNEGTYQCGGKRAREALSEIKRIASANEDEGLDDSHT